MASLIAAGLPVAAGMFAVPQFLPQLHRVWRGSTAGVSWTWAALTCLNNAAWIAYFLWSRYYTAVVPAAAAVVFAGMLAAGLPPSTGTITRTALLSVTGWSFALTLAGVGLGRAGLGTALVAAFVVQVAPAVWKAYRSTDISGISVGTWWLIFGELSCFGVYGLAQHDLRLTLHGAVGVTASALMLARIAWTRWIRAASWKSQRTAAESAAVGRPVAAPGFRRGRLHVLGSVAHQVPPPLRRGWSSPR